MQVLQSFGLPIKMVKNGPFSVSNMNEMMSHFHVEFIPVSSKYVGMDGLYLCHAESHFTGLCCREGLVRHFDNGHVKECSISFPMQLANLGKTTFFRLVEKRTHDPHRLCNVVGGAGTVHKPPATNPELPHFTCPLVRCAVPGCEGSLIEKQHVKAICYEMTGLQDIIFVPKQCSSRTCCSTYGYNFRWLNGSKINVLNVEDFKDDVIFASAKKGFSIQYLRYHEELLFRGRVSIRAIEQAYKSVFGNDSEDDAHDDVVSGFRKLHQTALFYFVALREFQVLNLRKTLVIDDEISNASLEVYQSYCHSSLFPPENRKTVKVLVGDGHLSLKPRGEDGPMKRAGRPRVHSKVPSKYSKGWFMMCDPNTGRIISLIVMHEPENNDHVLGSLNGVLWLYPKLKTFVYDRACSFVKFANSHTALDQIENYMVDWFHAYRHAPQCSCNPRV